MFNKKYLIQAVIVFIFISGSVLWLDLKKRYNPGIKQIPLLQSTFAANIDGLIIRTMAYLPGKPDSANYEVDSIEKMNRSFKNDSIAVQIEGLRALVFCTVHKPKNPDAIFNRVIALCRQNNYKQTELYVWQYLEGYLKTADTAREVVLNCEKKIIDLATGLKDIDQEVRSRDDMADIYLSRGNYSACESQLNLLLNDPRVQHSTELNHANDLLAALYTVKGDYPKALKFALKTEKYMTATGDSTDVLTLYGRLDYIYHCLNQYEQCIYYLKKAMGHAIATRNNDFIFKITNNIVSNLLAENKPGEALKYINTIQGRYKYHNIYNEIYMQKSLGSCYIKLRDYQKAGACYKKMIRLGETAGPVILPVNQKAGNYINVAGFYMVTKKYGLAKKYFLKGFKISASKFDALSSQQFYRSLFKADSALGNYRQAIRDLQKSDVLKDSIFTAKKQKQFAELQIAYQSEKKDKELQLSRAKIKADGMEKADLQNTRNWILAALMVLLLISGMLLRLSQIRRKSNQQISAKNALLEQLVGEKEWLLKEVHHRVKNNLHTVICLLESQAAYLENDALKAIENSQHRIYAMSLIHQKLYQSDDIKTIDMEVYLKEFIQYLDDSFGNPGNIKLQPGIEPVKLGVAQAIPVGLIINEAVTNAYKYAFPSGRRGTIKITLRQSENVIELVISDDGIGITIVDNFEDAGSLGMELIKGLSRDLRGDFKLDAKNGTCIRVLFEVNLLDKVVSGSTLSILA